MVQQLGQILLKLGYVTEAQLQEALARQQLGKEWFGETAVHLGLLTLEQVERIVLFQHSDKGEGKLFGVCAVGLGFMDELTRVKILRYQAISRGLLGDILTEFGYITDEQRAEAVRIQFEQWDFVP